MHISITNVAAAWNWNTDIGRVLECQILYRYSTLFRKAAALDYPAIRRQLSNNAQLEYSVGCIVCARINVQSVCTANPWPEVILGNDPSGTERPSLSDMKPARKKKSSPPQREINEREKKKQASCVGGEMEARQMGTSFTHRGHILVLGKN